MRSSYFLPIALILGALSIFASCKKDDDGTSNNNNNNEPKRWVKVYRDVVIGDDSNSVEGQFLDTRTGIVHKMQTLPDSLRRFVSLTYWVTETGSYEFLTAPGSLGDLPTGAPTSLIATGPGYGVNNWSVAAKNTTEYRLATYGGDITPTEFETLANTGTWTAFNAAFREANNGSDYLGFIASYAGASGGEVYLCEINNALRCILYVKSASADPASGFVRFDIIVEGREDALSGASALMPPM